MLRFSSEKPPENAVVVDFDNTIMNYEVTEDLTEEGPLVPGVKEALQQLKDKGCYIIVSSSRTASYWPGQNRDGQWKFIENYLTKNEVTFDEIWASDKPVAIAYIDDRAHKVEFAEDRSNWAEIVDKIEPKEE